MARNRPVHFHVWKLAGGDRAFFRLARPFRSTQAAGQFASRTEPDKTRYMVRQCDDPRCEAKFVDGRKRKG